MPPSAFKEEGFGTLDWKAILAAAAEARVDHYSIEQDATAGDPIRAGAAYLRKLSF